MDRAEKPAKLRFAIRTRNTINLAQPPLWNDKSGLRVEAQHKVALLDKKTTEQPKIVDLGHYLPIGLSSTCMWRTTGKAEHATALFIYFDRT